MPRPNIEPKSVLVRVHYSLVSVGTEIAPLRASQTPTATSPTEQVKTYSSLAKLYLGLAARNPRKAVQRGLGIAKNQVRSWLPAKTTAPTVTLSLGQVDWTQCAAQSVNQQDEQLSIVTDDSEAAYQVMSQAIAVPVGQIPIVQVKGTVEKGAIAIGWLNENQSAWLGSRAYDVGVFEDRLIFPLQDSQKITIVITTAGAGQPSHATLESLELLFVPPTENGLPHSELEDQGWNVGYSVAGEVIAVGEGINDLVPGDLVACGGAGQANHAEYVSVRRNLVCPLPPNCPVKLAASTTVGAIALQGVRRGEPQLGETICVLGLGLIGQIVAQLLGANGCTVIGMDLDQKRVQRAKDLGMDSGTDNPEALKKLIQDLTGGNGVDRTLITAATKSDAVINLAMEVTRRKGTVVIVGDVGLNVQRAVFYRKEIDLLMSTSYGPGRYDQIYEQEGQDYPFAYVRWTLNRNMQTYLSLIAQGRLNIEALIDRVVSIDQAPSVYQTLAQSQDELPLGVLIHYPEDPRDLPEPPEATKITIRGHKKAPGELINYALVGAGAFGTSMLVPQMQKRKDRFWLRGIVSRDAVRGGNFARANQVEVLATELDTVLQDPAFDLVVIATRHNDHASQVVQSLKAGKHVFVEKPLALTWEELDSIITTYESLEPKPLLMIGFNRRFSPALQALKEVLKERRSPLIINYRLNGGYIPQDSWIQTQQGGGRNLGEACHMYDVFRSLAGAPVTSITATAINPDTLPYQRNDNFCATLAYQDGSVGNLVYTALGPKQGLPKERVEVFCDGEAYIVDDYKSLVKASDGTVLWQSKEVDKGHFTQLSQFGDAIAAGTVAPIPFEQIIETSAVALQIEDLLYQRQGNCQA
ncbi:MAG: Gfo/Idh/MocA family oxidoreductase [Symploca sp. SIO2C1]|nr:Gfo/Idh/MocA family oxidoreductase [Symploca sp. SIO2C1]